MIKVWILTAMFGGDFSMTPFTTELACRGAIDGLSIGIVVEADCYPIEMLDNTGSEYAPILVPLPPVKPGRRA